MKTRQRNQLLRAVGAMTVLTALLPLMYLPSASAGSEGTGYSGDSRASSHGGNVTKCNDSDESGDGQNGAGLVGHTITPHVTAIVNDPNITITGVDSGWTVLSVVVKGGSHGYNVYLVQDLGSLSWANLHPPLNPNEEPAGISHWFVCGTSTPPTTPPVTTEPPTTPPVTTEPPTTPPVTTEPPTTPPVPTEPPTTPPVTTEPPTTPPITTAVAGGAGGGVTPDPTVGGGSTSSAAALPHTGANVLRAGALSAFLLFLGTTLIYLSRPRKARTH